MHDLAHKKFLGTRRFAGLDALRGLSVLAVLLQHTAPRGLFDLQVLRKGYYGVDMFFALSAFLITSLLLRERRAFGRIDLPRFWARRALRIVPAYAALLVGCVVVNAIHPNRQLTAALVFLPYLATFTADFVMNKTILFIAWSLAAEEQFYLVWPQIERWASRPVRIAAVLLFTAGNILWALAAARKWVPDEPLIARTTFLSFALGSGLAYVLDDEAGFRRIHRFLGGSPWHILGPVVLLGVVAQITEETLGEPRIAAQCAMALFLGALLVRPDHCLARLFAFPPLMRLGTVSYGVYLFHMPLRLVVDHALLLLHAEESRPLRFLCLLAVSWAFAEASYRLYETPFLRLRRHFAPRRPAAPAAESQPLAPAA